MSEALWIVGAGGLLGQELLRQSGTSFEPPQIPWHHPSDATSALATAARNYAQLDLVRWCVVWAAGAGVVGIDEAGARAELEQFRSAVASIRKELPVGRGTFFLASSAGGVYAGSHGAPFDERATPHPISAYGQLKLDMELHAADVLGDFCRVVIGRFTNIYGPGQNLEKSQGIVSQLCRHTLTRQALNIYVPLETLRDYIYVEDAAALALGAIKGTPTTLGEPVVRILASHEPASVARVIDLINRQSHHRPLISVGVDRKAAYQVRDLRMRTLFLAEQRVRRTSLGIGVARVFRSMTQLLQAGALVRETRGPS